MNFWDYIKNTKKDIILYGKGNGAEKLLDRLAEMGIKVSAIFSSEGFSKSKPFRGYEIKSLDEIKTEYHDFIILLAFGSDREDVKKLIEGVNDSFEMYAPHLPMYDSDFTDSEYFTKHENDIHKISKILADEQSIKVLSSVINFRKSAKLTDIWECESTLDEGYSLLKLDEDECYLDIGAYRGDTVLEFIRHSSNYRKIYAAEPNMKTFEKLKINTSDIKNIEYINAFISNDDSCVTVSTKDGRGSTISDKGKEVKSCRLDTLFKDKTITYIKIDAEGEEINIIEGGYDLILNQKPKMRIAAYHKANDIFDIVNKVLSIRSDYKVYLRHYLSVLDWNIDLYFV